MAGNGRMLIWLGKQILNQKDKSEISGADGGPLDAYLVLSSAERKRRIDSTRKRLKK